MGSAAITLTPPLPPGFTLQSQPQASPPPLPPGFSLVPSPVAQVGASLKNQAKGLFDMLSGIVDPHLGQKIGDAVIDAQVDQWHKAKQEYSQGNYANAFRRGLAAATPLLGPMIENTAEKATTEGRPYEAATDVLALPAVSELGARVPGALQATGRAATAAADAVAPVLGQARGFLASPGVRDAVGVISPRAAHAVGVANRVAGVAQRIRDVYATPQGTPPIREVGPPAALPPEQMRTPLAPEPMPDLIQGPQPRPAEVSQNGTATAATLKNDIARGMGARSYETLGPRARATVDRIAGRISAQPQNGAPARRAPIVPRGTPEEVSTAVQNPVESPSNNAAKAELSRQTNELRTASAKPTDNISAAGSVPPPPPGFVPETAPASEPLTHAESVKPEVAKTLAAGAQRTMPDGSTQVLERVPIDKIEGDPGNRITESTVAEYQKSGYALQPELRANPAGGFTIQEGHHRILADVRNGADSVLAWKPEETPAAAPAAPAVSPAGPPKEFGIPTAPAAPELPVLPGHQKLTSSMAHSAGFDPATGDPQIHFGPSKSAPGGSLYRYVDDPASGLPPVAEEFQKALKAESFGSYFREHIRPKYKGIRVQVPEPNAPLLQGVDYGKVAGDERQANPQGQAGPPASGSGQGEALPEANGARPQPTPADTTVRVPGSEKSYRARYEVRELADIQASHSGATFQPNPKYKNFNDRDYTQRENQGKVLNNSMAKTFDPAYLVTDNPDATNGPPVLESSGDVLGGNGRTMILHRVYGSNPTGAAAYKELLAKKAAQFGVDPAQLASMKQPVLVRVVDDAEFTKPEGVQDAVTDFNKKGTAELTPSERALADARRVSLSTLDDVAGKLEAAGSTSTLADALKGKNGTAVLDKLIADGVVSPQERAAYASGEALTKEGQARISKLLLGRFFRDPAQLDTTSPAIRTKMERIAAPLARVEGSAEWNLTPKVQEAMDLIEDARAHGSKNIEYFLKQEGLMSAQRYSADAVTLAKALQNATVKGMADAVNSYAQDAQFAGKGPGLFGEAPSPAKSFADAFGGLTAKAAKVADVSKGSVKLYRGTGTPGQKGHYFSVSKDFAQEFTGSGLESEIKSIDVPKADILDLGKSTPFAGNESEITAAIAQAKAKNAPAFYVSEGNGQPRSVFFLKPQKP